MERDARPDSSRDDDFWDDAEPEADGDYYTTQFGRVRGDRPDGPRYVEHESTEAQGNSGPGAFAIVLGVLAVIAALLAGVWAYSLVNGGNSASSTPETSTVHVSAEQSPAEQPSEEPVETEEVVVETHVVTETARPGGPTTLEFTDQAPAPQPEPEPEPEPRQTPSEQADAGGFRAPDDAVQCAANVNWRIFSPEGEQACDFAENVAIAMAPNADGEDEVQVTVDTPGGGQPANVTCRPEGGGSFTCTGGGETVVLEDRAVRD